MKNRFLLVIHRVVLIFYVLLDGGGHTVADITKGAREHFIREKGCASLLFQKNRDGKRYLRCVCASEHIVFGAGASQDFLFPTSQRLFGNEHIKVVIVVPRGGRGETRRVRTRCASVSHYSDKYIG